MPELEQIEQTKVAGFVDRRGGKNSNKTRIEKDEQELKELLADKETENAKEGNEEPKEGASVKASSEDGVQGEAIGKEEESFKKRYGDIRRHLSTKEKEFNDRLTELQSQLDKATKNELVLPKSEEEILAWTKKYPDVAAIVETIADKKARDRAGDLDKRLIEIESLRESATKEKAEAELMALHPDFATIREDDTFHEWADEQPKWVQDALYENSDDAKSVSRVIDLYKQDKGIFKPTTKSTNVDAAKSVKSVRNVPQDDERKSYLRESQVNRMSAKEYEKDSDSIMEAIRSGKFIYDISGGAR
mgnify:FL=1|tara:strand:+ start:164 stop:1075 length:912 start_codon:yes stop_codon:yes gene_type:complete